MTRLRFHVLVLCAFLGSGCSVITDFDRFGPGGDGGTDMDGQVLVDGCIPMGVEVCNDIDDDCDGDVDENVQDDPENCGACGFACQPVADAAPDCAAGECVPNCDTGFADCDGVYANGCEVELSDPDNCAACGEVCPTGEVCTASGCATDCPGSEDVCGRTCIDTTSSTDHCGGCDVPCADRPSAVTVCAAGTCDFVCTMGFDDCDGTADNGCETDLTTLTDCGTCSTVCSYPSGMPACTDGACELTACNPGFDNCDLDVATGCETDLSTTSDCGTCGNVCADPMSATGSCDPGSGTCDFSCDTGFADCDTDAGTGCEADLNSATTCGDCATSCSGSTPLCDLGTCVSGCSAPTPTRCGGSCVNTDTNILHCGACGTVCPTRDHSSPTCAPVAGTGTCGFACDVGWFDCDGMPGNGCERNIRTVTDCGSCDTACTITAGTGTCATGTCAIASCDTGFDDCGGGAADGCETDITAPADCGMCGNTCSLPNAIEGCSGTLCTVAGCTGGYTDCDGMASTGCEEIRGTYYRDADGDLFGTSESMQFCMASVPGGWASMTGDCADGDPFRNPGQTELCSGLDDDCDFATDEGFMVGDPCECVPGADRGTIMCVVGDPTRSTCSYPPESCNGFDDDCDGTIDNGVGFVCALGSARTCIGPEVGTQICIPDGGGVCIWGSCGGGETCDRVDNDGDGFVDEDGLVVGTPSTVTSSGGVQIRASYNPDRDEIGVLYLDSPGGSMRFVVVTPTGSVVWVGAFTTLTWDADIAYDGSGYTIVYSRGSTREFAAIGAMRVAAGSVGAGISLTASLPSAEFKIRVARIGTTNRVAAIWVVNPGTTTARVEGRRLDTPPAVLTVSELGGSYTTLGSGGSGTRKDWPFAATSGTTLALVGYADTDGSTGDIRVWDVTSGGYGGTPDLIVASDPDGERGVEIAADDSASFALVYERYEQATAAPRFTEITLATISPWSLVAVTSLGTGFPTPYVAYAADASFGVLLNGGEVRRFTANSLTPVPNPVLTLGVDQFLVGITSTTSPQRYVGFGSGGWSGVTGQPIECGP